MIAYYDIVLIKVDNISFLNESKGLYKKENKKRETRSIRTLRVRIPRVPLVTYKLKLT